MKETADIDRIQAMADAFADERLRWLIGKGDVLVQNGELTQEKFKELVDKSIQDEFERHYIMIQLKDGSAPISKIAKSTGLEPHRVLWNILALMKWNMVEITGVEKREYLYARSFLGNRGDD
ncbi:MAG: hypothetical protein ACFFEA_07085 [Candidatus Thorarchaeota archaeon]